MSGSKKAKKNPNPDYKARTSDVKNPVWEKKLFREIAPVMQAACNRIWARAADIPASSRDRSAPRCVQYGHLVELGKTMTSEREPNWLPLFGREKSHEGSRVRTPAVIRYGGAAHYAI